MTTPEHRAAATRITTCRQLALAAALFAIAGCQTTLTPWRTAEAGGGGNPLPSSPTTPEAPTDRIASADREPPLTSGQVRQASFSDPYDGQEPSREEAFAAVLSDLQEIGALDPVAHQELLDELQSERTSLWPQIVEQRKSMLAYRQELRRRNTAPVTLASAESAVSGRQPMFAPPPGPGQPVQQTPTYPVQPAMQTPPAGYAATPSYPATGNYPSTGTPPEAGPQMAAPQQRGGPQQVAAIPASNQSTVTEAITPVSATPGDWQSLLDSAINALQTAAPTAPATTADAYQHARLRLLALAAGDAATAAEPIPGLSPEEQDYWAKQMFALSTLLDVDSQPESAQRAAAASVHLSQATSELAELGSLTAHNLTFCKEVFGYGAYDPRASGPFKPGELATLYIEVENYSTETTSDGFHTAIGTSYELLDEAGAKIANGDFPVVDDYCLSRRRDFHIQYGVQLPADVAPGHYQLQLTLVDKLGDKIGKSSIELDVAAP